MAATKSVISEFYRGKTVFITGGTGFMGKVIFISSFTIKPINIRWIRTGSQKYWKIMSNIVLYPVFYELKKMVLIL